VEQLKLGAGDATFGTKVWVPPPSTLLALKVSQICFKHNWSKTAEDIVAMLNWFGRPMETILKESKEIDAQAGSDGPNLHRFIEERVCINAGVQYTVPGVASPALLECQRSGSQCALGREQAKQILSRLRGDESVVLRMMKQAEEDGDNDDEMEEDELGDYDCILRSRFLPIRIYETSFDDLASSAEKQRCLMELVMVAAVHHYIDSGRVKHMLDAKTPAHTIAEKVWRAALQTLCTNVLVEFALDGDSKATIIAEHAAWFQKVKLYDNVPVGAEIDAATAADKREAQLSGTAKHSDVRSLGSLRANPQRVKIPERAEVEALRIPFRSALVKAIINHFGALWTVPPVLVSYVQKLQGGDSTAVDKVLPADVWQHIILNAPVDHVALLALSTTCKTLNQLVNKSNVTDQAWERALNRFWKAAFVKNAVEQQGLIGPKPFDKFKAAFVVKWNRYHAKPIACQHCGDAHAPVPEEEWLKKNGGEHTEAFCVCPNCYDVTGSWGNCEYHDIFVI
jgi:hypothetical protein